ncbi:MAG TPA: hypothetical protein VF666_16100 [Pyrinomonadaceae bacterium]
MRSAALGAGAGRVAAPAGTRTVVRLWAYAGKEVEANNMAQSTIAT